MPNEQRPLKVFLCHAHSDKKAVHDLYLRLSKDGVDAWLSSEKLLPGQDRELEIRKAVRESDTVVVCLSRQFNQAGFQQKEVRLALDTAMEQPEGEIFIIPARLEECEIPESLKRFHPVDLFRSEGYEILNRSLKLCAEKKTHTWQTHKPEEKPKTLLSRLLDVRYISILIAMIVLLFGNNIYEQATGHSIFADASTPTLTTIPPVETSTPTVFNDLDLSDYFDAKRVQMALVPAGKFTMGSDTQSDEQPVHIVNLDAFYIDIYEVTNSSYAECVDSGVCLPPKDDSSNSHSNYYRSLSFSDYPVIHVDWEMANVYCEWREARLPSEAEWEKAARGSDQRAFPWGEDIDCSHANYSLSCAGDTMRIGSFENARSAYGVYDMAGNVWEWVADWYQRDYYAIHHKSPNYQGPETGVQRVIRGGSWYGTDNLARSANRDSNLPFQSDFGIGFRCAKDATP
ncbi:MAG: TIR domain-containing protein [Chloroflexi bacterium]|nr:MAG: TIR domain-containing protein [Chloroflexota bacterium]